MIRRAWIAAASTVAASVDRAAHVALMRRSERSRRGSRAESLGPEERIEALARIRELYDHPDHFSQPDTFFPAPGLVAAQDQVVREWSAGVDVVDLRWPSRPAPFMPDMRERLEEQASPRAEGLARWVRRRDGRRPTVILIHGYAGGYLPIEERTWPIDWLLRRGMDVALAVLPFHGARAKRPGRPFFPSSDPRITIEGFRQAMIDLRLLVSLLEARGATAVGAMGMSLGGYSTSLLATVEPRLAFAVPMIPLASIADIARAGGRITGDAGQAERQHVALEEAHRVVSPLARPARIDRSRIMVLAGESDRITPVEHAEKLATHFDAPIERFYGGHLLQFGRRDAFRAAASMWERLGLLQPRPGR